jgi:hypothetical protein
MAALTRSALAAAALIVGLAMWSDLSRFQDPVGEKYLAVMQPGAADFVAPYQGARALVAGVDPYRNQIEDFRDPWHREVIVDGAPTSQFYLPTHLWIYTPFVYATNGNPRAAGRIWFVINLLCVLALATITASLVGSALGLRERAEAPLILLCWIGLALHGGSLLGFERGQSDFIGALACWGAIASLQRGRTALAMFLATFAALLKGYAAPFSLALLIVVEPKRRWRALAGGMVALLVLLAPVARYLPEALANVRVRVAQFHPGWQNVSFRSLVHAPWAAWLLAAGATVASVLTVMRARRAMRDDPAARPFALAMMTMATLGTMLGISSMTYDYALVLVLPGLMVLALAHDPAQAALGLAPRSRQALAATTLVAIACTWKLRLVSDQLPLGAIGLVLGIGLAGAYAGLGLVRRGESRRQGVQ